jgi:hypothetical protein
MSNERTYTQAEVREILGLVLAHDWIPEEVAKQSTSDAVRDLFTSHGSGDLRHWGAFAEIVAFTYDSGTLEIIAVARTTSFIGNPQEALMQQLRDAGWDGESSMELWGQRHRWSSDRGPECLDSIDRSLKDSESLGTLVQTAWKLESGPIAALGRAP